ncbi:UDP-2,3-diacylglucosamine diphosphatase [Rhodomicrobium lacus]|uniref:UDP-2,3-diacylglucosamine diphosphatase n=1 Tax=Rhodomicrobium lacus TaxID=2498452 RepID=UPI0026E3341D|nr:UDP-2,3-diacylglucosamine diphosphatase [Rhodomicrobium lacus]WKW52274.1 UDP-2,3-diacylglucosamine diphosphatase [Rhodomicrobium lacus]
MHGFFRNVPVIRFGEKRYRALFLSDLHLGTRAAKTDGLIEFLRNHDAETVYLVGDIIDFWRLKRGVIWPGGNDEILQLLLERMQSGTRIVYVPGNHDEALRAYCGMSFSGIEIARDCVHTTANGRKLFVLHGDEFDVVVRYAKWLRFLGDRSYEFVLWCDGPLNFLRRKLGFGHWSLSVYVKTRVKAAAAFIEEFEVALAGEAKRRGFDGVVCGHIHHPADRLIDGVRYLNCGDWTENCTAIAEHADGRIEILHWRQGDREREPAKIPEPMLKAA